MKFQSSLNTVFIDKNKCINCHKCFNICPENVYNIKDNNVIVTHPDLCIGCFECKKSCPKKAITIINTTRHKFYISQVCNNNCIMCFEPEKNITSSKEILNLIDQNLNGKEKQVVLSGKEITMRKDFFDILKLIRKKNKDCEIFLPTNGRMFSYKKYTKKFIDQNLGNVMITISILGSNSKTHDSITQVKGSFNQAVKGIKNLLKHNQDVHINVTLMKQNYQEIPEIVEKFIEMGVITLQFALIEPHGKAKENFKEYLPRLNDLSQYLDQGLSQGKNKVIIKNIPVCQFYEYKDQISAPTQNHLKQKGKNCHQCKHDQECFGIWSDYIKLYGDKELEPII